MHFGFESPTGVVMGAARLINCRLSKFAWEFAETDFERFLQPVATLPARLPPPNLAARYYCLLVTTSCA